MSLENRPYIGTWRLNNKKVVKHTPDALVYVNGDLSVPGCATCGAKIDIQKYITQVSVDPSTEGPATASISMHIPKHVGDSLYRDGNFVLRPGLEIHIYMRGYFPVKGLFSDQKDATQTGGVDITNAVMYPYYLVHHGVITDVSHEYNGGEHTASISVTDLLHFWQYQRMSTNGSAFGARPTNSKVNMSLVGHNMTGMSPYAIIYTLFRDVQGSAGGVEFALGSSTNAAANSTVVGDSLFSLSILYWQKRFSQNTMSLRMFGVDGQLYNAAEAAFLASLESRDIAKLAESSKAGSDVAKASENDPILKISRFLGNPFQSNASAASPDDIKKGVLGVNPAQIQAFASDISQWGNVNLWESQYATKMEIANNVKEAVGYEFYMDVDGDIVFKPPFYNLDTSGNRVYRIEDIDIISLSVSEKEPECTVVKATGGHFKGMTGFGLENNEWGTRAEFVDYRMVAQFGWRQQTFETTYHTDPQAMFFACIARYDLFNIGVKSATLTIPIRPELRPGYPVYITPLDCYYYIHSFSHSLSFGGQCTTTLNLVGKRAKFYAPGVRPQDGTPATVSNITLENTYNPALPLEVSALDGVAIAPKLQGFPNVVMTVDPTAVNPLAFTTGIALDELKDSPEAVQQLIDLARLARKPVLQLDEDSGPADPRKGPFKVPNADGTFTKIPDVQALMAQAARAAEVYANKKSTVDQIKAINESTKELQILINASKQTQDAMFPESSSRYLELLSDLKASYNPGGALPGAYRYYSSAHPDAAMQGPGLLKLDPTTGLTTATDEILVDPTMDQTAMGFKHGDTTNQLSPIKAVAGIPIAKPGVKGEYVSTPTHQITTFQIAVFNLDNDRTLALVEGTPAPSYSKNSLAAVYQRQFFEKALQGQVGASTPLTDFQPIFDEISTLIQTNLKVTPVFPTIEGATTLDDLPGDEPAAALQYFTTLMAEACASVASKAALANASFQAGTLSEGQFMSATGLEGDFLPRDTNLSEVWTLVWNGDFAQTPAGKNSQAKPVRDQKPYYVPVFPVSDHLGYEVIGTYRYGRGMTTEQLGELNNYTPDSSPNYDQIEEFLAALRKGTDYSKVIGTMDAATKAELVAALDSTEAQEILTILNPDGTQTEQGGSNQPANAKKQTPLKLSVTNTAYSLADMLVVDTASGGTSPCACKGSEAQVLMLAFDAQFAEVEKALNFEDIQSFLQEQATTTATSWASVQAAYRGMANITLSPTGGTVINPTTAGQGSLLDAFSTAGEAVAGAARTAASNLTTSADALEAAQAALDEDIANFGGTGFGVTVGGGN